MATKKLTASDQPAEEKKLDLVETYCKWFLTHSSPLSWIPFEKPMWQIENVTSVLLHRKEQFQIQMFIAPPHTIIPEHTHPNVDSIEVYAGGQVHFSYYGKILIPEEDCIEDCYSEFGLAAKRGVTIRVKPDDPHGGYMGENGGIFLSVQHWLNDVKPHCVAADYTGKTMGPHHLNSVKFGSAYFDGSLSKNDSITKLIVDSSQARR